MQEARELANDPSTEYTAAPLEVRALPSVFPVAYTHPPPSCSRARPLGRHFCVYFRITAMFPVAHNRPLGVALYPAWAGGHGFRGGIVSLSDPASCGISIPTTKHHAPHSQRPV